MKKTCIFGQGCLELIYFMVIVAQLVRAPGCGPGGRGFEPHQSPHLNFLKSNRFTALAFCFLIWIFYS